MAFWVGLAIAGGSIYIAKQIGVFEAIGAASDIVTIIDKTYRLAVFNSKQSWAIGTAINEKGQRATLHVVRVTKKTFEKVKSDRKQEIKDHTFRSDQYARSKARTNFLKNEKRVRQRYA